MQVRVLFFGQLKDIVGRAEDATELSEGALVEDLFARYGQRYPDLARFRGSVVASVNEAFADWRSPLAAGDEVAFLPPVSGGSDATGVERQRQFVELVRHPIRVAELVAELKSPEDGAVAVFEGIARNHSGGRKTLYLEYEAYESMALAKLRELAAAMRSQFAVDCVALVHRLGRLDIGQTSVFIGVSAAHRRAALDACRFGIDTLKKTVPIWKKEYFEDGAMWAEGEVPTAGSQSVPHAASKSSSPESTSS
jgi:molybdopterin synthase catalytic subunit/molybdopterin converting factor small subunit